MNTVHLFKMTASSLLLAGVLAGCGPAGQRIETAAGAATPRDAAKAGKLSREVSKRLARHESARAIVAAEQMVALVNEDAGYRVQLGDAYLMAGRFNAAETSFSDALALSPGHDRAALKLALVSIALGKPQTAVALLDEHRNALPAADYGLAMALAGELSRSVDTLEAAVRSPGADAKTRQNLALSYALSGRWAEARVVAAQDLSPALLDARMTEWANFARPSGSWDQVASLLGVRPVQDAGQPQRLALRDRGIIPERLVAPVRSAAVEPQLAPQEAAPPAYEVVEAAPVVRADRAPVKTAIAPVARRPLKLALATPAKPAAAKPRRAVPRAVARPALVKAATTLKFKDGAETGQFAVQIGAFSSAAVASSAWRAMAVKVSALKGLTPTNAQVTVNSTPFHRLSVSGFANRTAAMQICTKIKTGGGNCFVRATTAGKSGAQFAATKAAVKPAKPAVKLAIAKPVVRPAKPAVKVAVAAKPTRIASR